MFTDLQIPVMFGAGTDAFAVNPNGTINMVTPAENAESVVFNYVPYGEQYGYQMWVDDTDANGNVHTKITATGGRYVASNITNGLCTVTVPINKVTSAMVGCRCYLRVVK